LRSPRLSSDARTLSPFSPTKERRRSPTDMPIRTELITPLMASMRARFLAISFIAMLVNLSTRFMREPPI
jgi:hypothetical protein